MSPRIARLAALGAFGACAGIIALFAYVAFLSRHTATGGMLPTLSVVTWISLGVVVVALVGAHVVVARELFKIATGRAWPV